MFKINNNTTFYENTYRAPTYILKQKNNYAPVLRLTNNVDYLKQIDILTQELLVILQTMLSLMQQVDESINEAILAQLIFLRENYPLKYTAYAKSCSTINTLLFSDNSLEFEDAQLSILYNELLNGERLTLSAQALILNLNKTLNDFVIKFNAKVKILNNYGNANIANLFLVTNYREQNYITIVEDKINEVTLFFENYVNSN